ncbi:glycosyl hydrolase family 61-domain-containing protein [Coprinopsis sp. MPI-PUGE-AT-0042]|nr:glycosyl hydrolase family 61-domain-containing protein [Coprinopsis sp. MPI-PUGE-AT-0042]
MKKLFSAIATALFAVTTVKAHGVWPAMQTTNRDPSRWNSTDLACKNAPPADNVCQLKPGDRITIEFHTDPVRMCGGDHSFLPTHPGPVIMYLASTTSATSADERDVEWFKIYESGLLAAEPRWWATNVGLINCNHFTFSIPVDLAPGEYLLRAETISLHFADQWQEWFGGTQHYPGCFQISISGNGTAKPPARRISAIYNLYEEPGLKWDIYSDYNAYPIPGPEPYGYEAPPTEATKRPEMATASWDTALEPTGIPTEPASTPLIPQPPLITPSQKE